LQNHVTGRFDRDTEQALATLFKAAGDRSPNQRLATGHPLLQKISQNQSLTVVEGTAAPYEARRTAAKPRITLGQGLSLLPAEQKKLEALVVGLSRDFGLAFNIHITAAQDDDDILIAHFVPVGCTVHNGRRWCQNINSADTLRTTNKSLFALFAREIKQRAEREFSLTHPSDLAVASKLNDEIAAVVRPKVAASLRRAHGYIKAWREDGRELAAQFLEHYLSASGTPITVTREVALSFDLIRTAVAKNIERFQDMTFLKPEPTKPHVQALAATVNGRPGTQVTLEDYWKYDFQHGSPTGIGRYASSAWDEFWEGDTSATENMSFFLSAGSSHLTSTGKFDLMREHDHVRVFGRITHVWTDEGYNFDPGGIFANDAALLEAAGLAKPFSWRAEWVDILNGSIAYFGVPAAVRRPFRKWLTFDVTSTISPPQ